MKSLVETYGTALCGVVILAVFVVAAPNFARTANLLNVLKDTSFLAILALGFAAALTVAELDLAIADIASLAAVSTGALIQAKAPPAAAVIGGLAVGLGCGLFNGIGVTVLRVPSLIVTLGTAAIARGLAFWLTQGVAFVGRWPDGFTGLARGATIGVPNLVLWLAVVAAAGHILLTLTPTGARMTATGEAEEAARRAGIPTARMKRLGLALSGLAAGLVAVLLAANLSSAAPNMAGDYFLYAIAAVLLGMTMFRPGHANVPGTVFAAFVLKALGNGLVLLGAAYYVQDIVLGAIIIGSVAVSARAVRRVAFRV